MDAALVQAVASMDSLQERKESIKPPLSVHEYVHRLYTENTAPPESELLCPPSSPTPCSTFDTRVPPRYRKARPDGRHRKANNELVSRTDPEATVVSRRGFGLHLAYKAHVAVAGAKGQVITAALATTGAKPDEHLLGEMLRNHSSFSGLPVKEVVADAKYGTIANYEFLHHVGLAASIPPRQRLSQPRGGVGQKSFPLCGRRGHILVPSWDENETLYQPSLYPADRLPGRERDLCRLPIQAAVYAF